VWRAAQAGVVKVASVMQMRTMPKAQKRGLVMLAISAVVSLALIVLLAMKLVAAGAAVSKAPTFTLTGKPAPDFTTQVYNGAAGETIHLAALKGKPVVVNFFASWCSPCVEEAPILHAGWQKWAPQGVVFVGIVYQDTQQNALDFARQYNISYAIGSDPNGDTAIAYGVTGVPESIFINRQGIVVSKMYSALDSGSLDRSIQAIIQ
jgi:cytochrome c biogenesis protein CcmG/thiol:disulfide interchange protein DsbE